MIEFKATLSTPYHFDLAREFLAKLAVMESAAPLSPQPLGTSHQASESQHQQHRVKDGHAQQQVVSQQLQPVAGSASSPAELAGQETGAASAETGAAPETVKKTRKSKGTATAEAAQDTAQPDPAATVPDRDAVHDALQSVVSARDMETGINLLREFGAGRISELAEDKRADFVKACQMLASE